MSGAICKTCGGELPNHVPSRFDPDGIGNPAHKLGVINNSVFDNIPADEYKETGIKPQVVNYLSEHVHGPYIVAESATYHPPKGYTVNERYYAREDVTVTKATKLVCSVCMEPWEGNK